MATTNALCRVCESAVKCNNRRELGGGMCRRLHPWMRRQAGCTLSDMSIKIAPAFQRKFSNHTYVLFHGRIPPQRSSPPSETSPNFPVQCIQTHLYITWSPCWNLPMKTQTFPEWLQLRELTLGLQITWKVAGAISLFSLSACAFCNKSFPLVTW